MTLLTLSTAVDLAHLTTPKPEPQATELLHVGWLTYDATLWGVIIATLAAIAAIIALSVAIADARNNSTQLQLLLDERSRHAILTVDFYDLEIDFLSAKKFGDEWTHLKFTLCVNNNEAATLYAENVVASVGFPIQFYGYEEWWRLVEQYYPKNTPRPVAMSTIFNPKEAPDTTKYMITPERLYGSIIDEEGYRWANYSNDSGNVILPGTNLQISRLMDLYFKSEPQPIRWVVSHKGGRTPAKGYGELNIGDLLRQESTI